MRLLDKAMENTDAIIVADYGKGCLSQPLADSICSAARERGKILTVDPHPHTSLSLARNYGGSQAESRRGLLGIRRGALGWNGGANQRSRAARSRAAPAIALEPGEPLDHAGGAGHAAV